MKAESSSRTENTEPEAQNATSAPKSGSPEAPSLTEDAALAIVKSPDVTAEGLARLAKNPGTSRSRKVMVAITAHPRTPRHISIPLLRSMFTFDLMNMALSPRVPPDIKRAAEEQILARLESLPIGQKITLAKRASGRVAAGLLQTPDRRVISPALDNKQLTEVLIVQALMKPRTPEMLFTLIGEHPTWPLRREIQIALLRSNKTPFHRVQEFAQNFSQDFLSEILPDERKSMLMPDPEETDDL